VGSGHASHPQLAVAAGALPDGADERDPARNDSVLAVYVVFGTMPFQVALHAVKYVWSRTVPPGTILPGTRARTIVLRSGPLPRGEWVTESVDVRRDYERLFGEPPPRVRGVAILTDADATRTRAVGDYGPLRACPASGS
jgi:hypothetical protein